MRGMRCTLGMLAIGLGACGSQPGKTTTPTAKDDKKSPGSVVYEDKPGGFAPTKAPPGAPAPQDIEPVDSAPKPATPVEAGAKPKIKPPTQDLPPDKRDALVTAELRKGATAI